MVIWEHMNLNYIIQKFNPNIDKQVQVTPTKVFRIGDRVIQTRNNYDLNVFNGTVGK